jgi:hypothetical protein
MDIALPKHEGPPVADGRLILHPSGKSAFLVVRDGGGGYHVTEHEGPTLQTASHSLEDIDSLVRWAKRNLTDTETAEILVSQSSITADPNVEDETSPVATMRLQDHFRLARWKNVFGKKLGAAEFRKILLDGQEDTEGMFADERRVGSVGTKMAQAVGKMKVSQEGKVSVEMNDLGYIEAHGVNGKTVVDCKLDPTFKLSLPIYLGILDSAGVEPHYDVEVRINLDVTQDGTVLFTLSPTNLDAAYQNARKDIGGIIATKMGSDVYVGLGTRGVRQFTGDVGDFGMPMIVNFNAPIRRETAQEEGPSRAPGSTEVPEPKE